MYLHQNLNSHQYGLSPYSGRDHQILPLKLYRKIHYTDMNHLDKWH